MKNQTAPIQPLVFSNYLVKLNIEAEGYELDNQVLVVAQSGEYAEQAALRSEQHGEEFSLMPDEWWVDPVTGFRYQIESVVAVEDADAKGMHKYMTTVYESYPLLKQLINVMARVIESNLDFDMKSFYADTPKADRATDIHSCGTAACIAGYGAVDPTIRAYLQFPDLEEFEGILDDAMESIMEALEDEIGVFMQAICYGQPSMRRLALLGTTDALRNHPHVKLQFPPAEEALDFMQKVLRYLEEEYAKNG